MHPTKTKPGTVMPQLIATVQGVEIKSVQLNKSRTTLGRKPGNDIVLDNMVVSSEHCVFELEGLATVYLRDLGSTNGTCVNDRVTRDRVQLHDGDVVSIGPFRIRYLQAGVRPSGFGGLGQTMAFRVDAPQASVVTHACFHVLSGPSQGQSVPLVKAVTTLGQASVCAVSVSQRPQGYFVRHLAGGTAPLLDGQPVGDELMALTDQAVLDLAGVKMRFDASGGA